MSKIKILCDSCADLGNDIRQKYDIDYCKMNIVVHGEEKVADLDWIEYSPREMYDIMRHGDRITTTQVPPAEFDNVFRKYVSEGFDIIYIGCASPLSGSVNTGKVIANKIIEEYPERKITCIDSVNASLGEGMCAVKAAQLVKDGVDYDTIVSTIEEYKFQVNEYCTVNTLDYLKRAGRVTGSSAFFGNLFGVKPIITCNIQGQQVAKWKVKGRSTSLAKIVELLKDSIVDSQQQTVYISHADAEEDANVLKDIAVSELSCEEVYVNNMGPIIGASVGPGAIAIFGTGKNTRNETENQ